MTLFLVRESKAKGKLFVTTRPRPAPWLSDDIEGLAQAGVDHVVSMLPKNESVELGLESEGKACKSAGIGFHNIALTDRTIPLSSLHFLDAVRPLALRVREGESLAVHCRASIGRATLFSSALLLCEGVGAGDALAQIEKARGCKVPDTREQIDFVHELEKVLRVHRVSYLAT